MLAIFNEIIILNLVILTSYGENLALIWSYLIFEDLAFLIFYLATVAATLAALMVAGNI